MKRFRRVIVRGVAGAGLLLFVLAAGLAVGVPAALADSSPVLVVVAHPDDEALGFSGVIESALAAGRPIYVAVVTNGASRRLRRVESDGGVWGGDGDTVGGGAAGAHA